MQLQHRVEHAEPGAQHRHDDDVAGDPARRRPARAASRPSPSVAGRSRVASAASSRLMRTAMRRNSSGGVVASRSVDERVVHERVLDEVDRHGDYTTAVNRCQGAQR